ncbi:MAG: energy transducer TonB [Bacteroidales bacterium]|nr:energy transducer TonB [Bacteroidales bacterium]NLK81224.1 energy transducer TonB [Bacteroidales bacterium]
MKNLIALIFLLITNSLFSQVLDTIWYDAKWQKCTKTDAIYYRIATYNTESNNYSVVDYYKSGKIQMTGTFTSIEPEVKDGMFVWYLEDGNSSQKIEYKNNVIIKRVKNGVEIPQGTKKHPEFPGGMTALAQYIQNNTIYPTKAAKQKIQGKVVVKFRVNANGKVDNVQVINSVHPLLKKEAMRIVKSFPKFIPGELNGTTIPFYYTVPIDFQIPKN